MTMILFLIQKTINKNTYHLTKIAKNTIIPHNSTTKKYSLGVFFEY